MKNAAFKSAGAKFQFKHKFGHKFGDHQDEAQHKASHHGGPETDVLSKEDLTAHAARDADKDTGAQTGASGETDLSSGDDELQLAGGETDADTLADTEESGTAEPDGIETDPTAPADADSTLAATAGDDVAVTGTYSDEAIAELLFMIEEEKLAGDIYETFYDMYGLKIFDNIAESEDQHFSALISQAEGLGLDVDQFLFEPAGTFTNPELQEMYDTLLAQGTESVTGALKVGKAIEEKDMVDIADAIEDVEGTALADVYENLLAGSANHLEAFDSLLMV